MAHAVISSLRYSSDALSKSIIENLQATAPFRDDDRSVIYYDYPIYSDYDKSLYKPDICVWSADHGFFVIKNCDAVLIDLSATVLAQIDSELSYRHIMKLGFEESQSTYSSGSQNARAWTEAWVSAWAYCPHCGNGKISSFPNNSPLADFFCASCSEEFELKSQKGKFGTRVVDGAFKTKCERLAASTNPNLFLLNYDLKSLAVVNLFIVPKHFFVREIIEERRPLAATARRAGWIGSNILLSRVPESGKIHIVQGGVVRAKELVLADWQRTLFLRNEAPETRGWLLDVMKCVESLGKRDFTLDEIYAFERHLGDLYPGNQNVKPKIRQQLQYLRDRGFIDFVSRGNYRLRS